MCEWNGEYKLLTYTPSNQRSPLATPEEIYSQLKVQVLLHKTLAKIWELCTGQGSSEQGVTTKIGERHKGLAKGIVHING